jgi:hypothetical protein
MDNFHFFAQDDDCHWYLIPSNLRKTWDKWVDKLYPWDTPTGRMMSSYRIDGCPSQYEFQQPRKI